MAQRIWLAVLHGMDTYFLALYHTTARGFLEKGGYSMYCSPTQPWFGHSVAQNRLDEAISLAVVLKRNGRVVSEADFAKQEVQRDLVRRELDMPNPVQPVQDYMLSDDTQVVKAAKYQVHTMFMRDVFDAIRKDGWFEDEQKP